ncbi:MAG: alanine racemase [Deltaproteobacteria bacterium]|nr:alanine racemase [Deltaproteobacteria bacterium]
MSLSFNIARINLESVAYNLDQVRKAAGPGVRIMGVVKADAYGHGLLPVAKCLVQSGVDALGVMDLHEALTLRDNGLDLPVFILAGFEAGHSEEIVRRGLTPFVYDLGLAYELNQAARKHGRKVQIHLKLDTGMNRLGAPLGEAEKFLEAIRDLEHLEVMGLASHFSEADLKESEFTFQQLEQFGRIIKTALRMGYRLSANNIANSAAVLSLPQSFYDLIRPGLVLYGAAPAEHLAREVDLRPVMTFISQVIQVKRIGPGSPVSYGRTWAAERKTVLATIPVGYAHGYGRGLSNGGYVLIRGRQAPVRGVVCMNLTMVDVTDIPGVEVGDEVVLLGTQDGEIISAPSLARMLGTISYEIFCTIGGLNHRQYVYQASDEGEIS